MKNGFAESRTTEPMVRLRPTRSWRAVSFRTKPNASISAVTRWVRSKETRSGLLRTFETVPVETRACGDVFHADRHGTSPIDREDKADRPVQSCPGLAAEDSRAG